MNVPVTRRALGVLLTILAAGVGAADDAPIERWLDLTPPGWNPFAKMNPLLFGRIQDGSPEAVAAMEQVREALDNAPTVEALAGRAARLPGYVVPLQSGRPMMRPRVRSKGDNSSSRVSPGRIDPITGCSLRVTWATSS